MRRRTSSLVFLALLCFGIVGCESSAQYEARRRNLLLEQYPPGKTTRADVKKKWPSQTAYAATRPAAGWTSLGNAYVRERALRSEQRIGQPVASLERYWGPDARSAFSFGLCYIWFYYDAADLVQDAEWQYASD